MNELYKPVVGYEGLYEVSDVGSVRNTAGKVLSACKERGYRRVSLHKEGRRKTYYVHSLVLAAFVSLRPEGMDCCHCNGRRDDNRVVNLRWDTRAGNFADKVEHGTKIRGEACHLSRLTETDVRFIKNELAKNQRGVPTRLAKMFGITKGNITAIKQGKSWAHVSA